MDYRQTFRTLERALASIERSAETAAKLSGILEAIVEGPGPALGIHGARLYRRSPQGDAYVLEVAYGARGEIEPGFRVAADYPPMQRVVDEGLVIVGEGDLDFDPAIERRIGVKRFASIAVGDGGEHIIALTLDPEVDQERAIYLLGTLRHIINLKLLHGQWVQDLEEARRIQTSLLPARPPDFHGFDIAARSVPAEEVGGDLYDFVELSDRVLGVAIADSSGHGLPAALMARDVITGLRVVLDVQYRMTRAIERVNRVVSRSALASRFITLFYAEFERTGNMVYCNAGHPPPLLIQDGQVKKLEIGGLLLGPEPSASYERGFERFVPGSTLLFYTDGIVEAQNRAGKEFGVARLERLLRQMKGAGAAALVDAIFAEAERFAHGPQRDDQTVVVVRRPVGNP